MSEQRVANREPKLFATARSLFAFLLLLAGNRLGRPLARARVGMSTLAAHRQSAAMAQASIAAEIHQPLDIDTGLPAEIAFHDKVTVDHFADLKDLLVGQLADTTLLWDLDLLDDVGRNPRTDAMDVLERDYHALVGRDIHAGNTGHELLSCRDPRRNRLSFLLSQGFCCRRQASTNANTTPTPFSPGARHRLKTIRLDAALINGWKEVSSTSSMP